MARNHCDNRFGSCAEHAGAADGFLLERKTCQPLSKKSSLSETNSMNSANTTVSGRLVHCLKWHVPIHSMLYPQEVRSLSAKAFGKLNFRHFMIMTDGHWPPEALI